MIKILIVDDHHLVRDGLKRIIERNVGMKVVAEASSGEESIAMCRSSSPHVVLMDVRMPGIGGLEATRKLLLQNSDLKVLVISICNDDIFPSRLLQIGASGYITKDATEEEMVKAIRAIATGKRYISAEIASSLALRHVQENDDSPFENLSEREMQVLLMITMGVKVPDIADKLCLSPKTVNSYRYRIFAKLGVKNDVEMTLLAIRHGLVEAENTSDMV